MGPEASEATQGTKGSRRTLTRTQILCPGQDFRQPAALKPGQIRVAVVAGSVNFAGGWGGRASILRSCWFLVPFLDSQCACVSDALMEKAEHQSISEHAHRQGHTAGQRLGQQAYVNAMLPCVTCLSQMHWWSRASTRSRWSPRLCLAQREVAPCWSAGRACPGSSQGTR